MKAHYFTPLIGTKFGSSEFDAAIAALGVEQGKSLSYQLIDAPDAGNLWVDRRLARLYPNEKILVITDSQDGEITAIYRAKDPYSEAKYRDIYPDGDKYYVLPRYFLSKPYDKTLSSFLLYYLSITAHRYLQVIESFYRAPANAVSLPNRDGFVHYIEDMLRGRLGHSGVFTVNATDSTEIKSQKRECKKRYASLVTELAKIILRRAEPFNVKTIEEVIETVFTSSVAEIERRMVPEEMLPVDGPNDEMELTARFLLLGLKLAVHDFRNAVLDEREADFDEAKLLGAYLMTATFVAGHSDGVIIPLSAEQWKELKDVMWEIHGEVLKGCSCSGQSNAIAEGEDASPRQAMGYQMLDNRIGKILRCAYFIDYTKQLISEIVGEKPELQNAIKGVAFLAKVKVFTSAASPEFMEISQKFVAATNALSKLAEMPEHNLSSGQRAAVAEFLTSVSHMTETKRRSESAPERIRAAANLPKSKTTGGSASVAVTTERVVAAENSQGIPSVG